MNLYRSTNVHVIWITSEMQTVKYYCYEKERESCAVISIIIRKVWRLKRIAIRCKNTTNTI